MNATWHRDYRILEEKYKTLERQYNTEVNRHVQKPEQTETVDLQVEDSITWSVNKRNTDKWKPIFDKSYEDDIEALKQQVSTGYLFFYFQICPQAVS